MAKKTKVVLDVSEFVTQAEAAARRKVSLASINDLVRRGRLVPVEILGRKVLRLSDVLTFKKMQTGPKPGAKSVNKKRGKKR